MEELSQIDRILKAWLEVTDSPPLIVPAYAQQSSVKIDPSGTVSMRFSATTAELDAIAMGRRYEVEKSKTTIALLEFTPSSSHGVAKDKSANRGYVIEAQDPQNTQAIAYYTSSSKSDLGVALEIVSPGQIQGSNQIAIKAGGSCEVSNNLIGKTIKIRMPVTYPEVITIAQEPIRNITAHIVTLMDSGSVKYLELPSILNTASKDTSLKLGFRDFVLKFLPQKVKFIDLSINASVLAT